MRNSEFYRDPTAGKAMTLRPQRLESIEASKKAPVKKNQQDKQVKKIYYNSTPVYVAK